MLNDIDINAKQIFTYIDYSFSIKIINIIIHIAFEDILSKGAKWNIIIYKSIIIVNLLN